MIDWKRATAWVIAAVCLSAAWKLNAAELTTTPFSFDTTPGRLPKDVVPVLYKVRIVPAVEARTFTGTETIRLRFRQAASVVQFNSLNEVLKDVSLDGRPVKDVRSDDTRQLTTVTLASKVSPGLHTLRFNYSGPIEKQPHGLFAQPYVLDGDKRGVLLSTQMESVDARRMLPCWDEPAFRAQFALTVVVPATWTALSNMPVESRVVHGGLATVAFRTSPTMPSYLVEFTAGDIAQIKGRSGATQLGVWAVRGQEQNGKVALENAAQILADYNDYFGVAFPLPKLDSIAIPGGFGGAMENWGAITYNDRALLLTPNSTMGDRQLVYSVQAHEMAHQWSGDLVTMGWWDDIWLNESFASWRAAKETDLRNPSWKWWESQDTSKEGAMTADARPASHAIQQHVVDEQQVENSFDPEITYDKGQAVLRMLEAYMGPDAFREGVRRYMKAHAYSNATTADLWAALISVSGKDIAAIAADWTSQAGFPLIDVSASCADDGARTIRLSQKRFLLRGNDDRRPVWRVPLQVRSAPDTAPQSLLLNQDAQTAAAGRCGEPLSVNANAIGFYRVHYDAATLATNTHQFASLAGGDRIALLDDQWAMVEANRESLADYLALVGEMGDDLDTRAWEQIAHALEVIEYAERGSPGHDAFVAYARNALRPASERLGWDARPDESPNVQKLRRKLIGELGAWDDPAVVAEAHRRFERFLKDRTTLSPDDQATVLRIVMRNADTAIFEQVHGLARAAKDEADIERYYLSLTVVRNPELAQKVVDIALSHGELPPQAFLPAEMVADLNTEHHQLAWSSFIEHVDELLAPYPSDRGLIIAQYVPAGFWDAVPLDELESWVRAHVPAELSESVDRGMQSARFQASEKQALIPEADAFLQSQSGR